MTWCSSTVLIYFLDTSDIEHILSFFFMKIPSFSIRTYWTVSSHLCVLVLVQFSKTSRLYGFFSGHSHVFHWVIYLCHYYAVLITIVFSGTVKLDNMAPSNLFLLLNMVFVYFKYFVVSYTCWDFFLFLWKMPEDCW